MKKVNPYFNIGSCCSLLSSLNLSPPPKKRNLILKRKHTEQTHRHTHTHKHTQAHRHTNTHTNTRTHTEASDLLDVEVVEAIGGRYAKVGNLRPVVRVTVRGVSSTTKTKQDSLVSSPPYLPVYLFACQLRRCHSLSTLSLSLFTLCTASLSRPPHSKENVVCPIPNRKTDAEVFSNDSLHLFPF